MAILSSDRLQPYVDQSLTHDKLVTGAALPTQTIDDGVPKVHNHQPDESYDDLPNTDRDGPHGPETAPAHKPSFWEVGYDPYTNNGSPSQGFLDNPPT